MRPSTLINMSYGDRVEARKKDHSTPSRKLNQSPSSRPRNSRLPYSPDLGASPELNRGSKNANQRSPDVRLESQGSTGTPHQRGWFSAGAPLTTPPGQFNSSPNSAFIRPQLFKPGDQSGGSPQSAGGDSRGR